MIWRRKEPLVDAASLFESERQVAALPQSAQNRMLARAKAALRGQSKEFVPWPPSRRTVANRWAAAAGFICLSSAAAGAAAYAFLIRTHRTETMVAPVSVALAPRQEERIEASPPVDLTDLPASMPSPVHPRANLGREELQILRVARVAVAHGKFEKALRAIAEHARRFKGGRLAEEREALRVKALTGLGRTGEAHRAAMAFAAQFPRSPLLPAINEMSSSPPSSQP